MGAARCADRVGRAVAGSVLAVALLGAGCTGGGGGVGAGAGGGPGGGDDAEGRAADGAAGSDAGWPRWVDGGGAGDDVAGGAGAEDGGVGEPDGGGLGSDGGPGVTDTAPEDAAVAPIDGGLPDGGAGDAVGGVAGDADAGGGDANGAATSDVAEDGVGDDAGGAPGAAGSWEDPIPVGVWPFVHQGDTTAAPAAVASSYACAPDTDESGGEVVYAAALDEAARLTVTVSDLPGDGVDVDVHLLSAPDPAACIARGNVTATATVPAGLVFVVVDTWVDAGGVAKPGPYTLSIKREGAGDCEATGVACPLVPPAPPSLPAEPPGLGGCPPGMTRVETFCVDRWEAALVDVAAGAPLSPYAHPPSGVRAVSVPGVVPQTYISQLQAGAACAAAGKRLCTDDEWVRACRGPADDAWPYGPVAWPGFCNDARACHPAIQTFGTSAAWVWSSLGDPCIAQQPWGLAPTGAYAACESAEGAYDLVGNAHEWTADPAGTFRGGYFVDTVINGAGCGYKTTAHDVSHWDYSTGFRCCADP